MKREKLKYEVYDHYSWFGWYECWICGKEFRREKGFRLYLYRSFAYVCSEHATSKEEAIEAFDQRFKWRPKNVPTAPPPKDI